ncbi:NAD(P)H-binding protein [Kitasatospora sp. NPDC058162]|uniref:NAD(P)H-binding protein n=1 Tax=Kitasatospora sp. NPDC058162 TaxID=3346362 RepID=UPI0036DC0CD5
MVTVVFGAGGSVGRHVVAGLLAAGGEVRLTSRDPRRVDLPAGVEAVAADLDRPETLGPALAGAERVFAYAKPAGAAGFAAAARAAGVRHVVLLSSVAAAAEGPEAESNPIVRDHRAVEDAIEAAGLAWTFVRPGVFATNSLWWWRDSVRSGGPVRLPYPEAQTAPVHEADIAALAVAALTGPGHEGRAYTVFGPESLTLRRQVELIGAAAGREVAVERVDPEEARAELALTMEPVVADMVLAGWAAQGDLPAPVSDVVATVTGRPGRTFAAWASDHAADFR